MALKTFILASVAALSLTTAALAENTGTIVQNGNGNAASVGQRGGSNTAAIGQTGNGNAARLRQLGF